MLTAAQVASKWSQNTAAATNALKMGVQNVSVSPMEKAANAQDKYLAGVNAAVTSGRYAAALRNTSLEDWKASMLGKGLTRIPQGVQDATKKFQAHMEQWLPYEEAMSRRVAQMPSGSLAASQARSAFAIAYNAAWSKRLAGAGEIPA